MILDTAVWARERYLNIVTGGYVVTSPGYYTPYHGNRPLLLAVSLSWNKNKEKGNFKD